MKVLHPFYVKLEFKLAVKSIDVRSEFYGKVKVPKMGFSDKLSFKENTLVAFFYHSKTTNEANS